MLQSISCMILLCGQRIEYSGGSGYIDSLLDLFPDEEPDISLPEYMVPAVEYIRRVISKNNNICNNSSTTSSNSELPVNESKDTMVRLLLASHFLQIAFLRDFCVAFFADKLRGLKVREYEDSLKF